jgi:hypothetical protein
MDDAPDEANHIGIYSLLSRETTTSRFTELQKRYETTTAQQFGTYSAYAYDLQFVIMKTMLQTQSVAGKDIIALQSPTCMDTFGVAGWDRLDEFGDRFAPPYDVWGFYPGDDKPSVSKIMAQYDPDSQVTTFMVEQLGFTPIGP